MRPTVVGSARWYRTTEVLGEDGLGTLWRGVDARSGAGVCIRFLRPGLTADAGRAQRVTDRLRQMQWRGSNPHLAKITDHDLRPVDGSGGFVVYEGSEGETLAARLDRGERLSVGPALRVLAAAADGLAAAHAAWVTHGAVTATSLLLHDHRVVTVIDVGLGELVSESDRGAILSPTLAERGAADVLALTGVLDRMVTGTEVQPDAEDDAARSWELDVSADLRRLLARARSPHPRLRPSMAQLAAALAPELAADAADEAPAAGVAPSEPIPRTGEPLPTASDLAAGPFASAPVAEPAMVPVHEPAVSPPAPWEPPRSPVPEAAPPSADRRRSVLVGALAACLVLATVAGVVLVRRGGGGREGPAEPTGGPTPTTTVVVTPATVPSVLGRRPAGATAAIEEAGLVVGSVTTVPGPDGIVVRTDPTPGEAVVAGTPVNLFVGDGGEG